MKREVRVCKVPECGYVVIGRGTHQLGRTVDVSSVDREELEQLFADGYVEEIQDGNAETTPLQDGR